ncbi:BTB/POZ and MATH domain-containing protein 2-like [Phragmites australis]|uniref:BTB/POZ and MATH domain-containing protein 2-like n=1 Tax=Phragmites australis TaxID=29695 RepID=UPI002D768501|nr:BTB/POZ and MATH domain-containing protein 2-like [Phragmites australis]
MSSSAPSAVGSGDGGTPALSASAIVADAVTGSHVLKINGYSRTKGLGSGKFICSGIFNVGGHRWCIKYYPDGEVPDSADWISMYLNLDHTDALNVKARFRISLLDEIGEPVSSFSEGSQIRTFSSQIGGWGFKNFIEKKTLEESTYLKDDCFRVRCDITVTKEIRIEDAAMQFVTVPPSNIHRHLGHLLSSEEGMDVTFEVDGETISAHRLVLAARSLVFKAELYGPMKEKTMSHIRIIDMEARVFKAMLHFIYTDLLPEIDKDDAVVMAQHLLVAADRYGLERLKLICEDMLCNYINTSTAATTLALAEQHGCHGLKEACFNFLEISSNFKALMASDGFQHLMSSCPSVLKELLAKVVP